MVADESGLVAELLRRVAGWYLLEKRTWWMICLILLIGLLAKDLVQNAGSIWQQILHRTKNPLQIFALGGFLVEVQDACLSWFAEDWRQHGTMATTGTWTAGNSKGNCKNWQNIVAKRSFVGCKFGPFKKINPIWTWIAFGEHYARMVLRTNRFWICSWCARAKLANSWAKRTGPESRLSSKGNRALPDFLACFASNCSFCLGRRLCAWFGVYALGLIFEGGGVSWTHP